MLRKLIIDSERNLLEKNDLLGTMCYADQMVDAIKNVPNEQAYTIGLYGSWGSGKSTIIRTAKQKLESDKQKRIKVVVYDAWKYSGDSFRRMFLLHLQNELELNTTPEMERFYKATTEELVPNISLRERGLIYLICSIVAILVAILMVALLGSQDARIWTTLIFSAISVLAASFGGNLFYELKISQTQSILFAPEQFEECFRQMMVKVLKKKSWYKRLWRCVREYFTEEMLSVELDKLVIVIDNLDRCDTEVVYSMLTDIKTFLGIEKYDVVFVIPVDHDALRKHLFSNHEDRHIDAEEFLRKFFNVVIRIKEHRHDDLLHYVNELNRDQKQDFNPDTLSIVAKEYAENPRRIVQMLNNLTVEQSLYNEDFARMNETLIAVCMILREHYPEVVAMIIDNPIILTNGELYEMIGKTVYSNEGNDYKIIEKQERFKTTLSQAKYTLKNSEPKDVKRILSNTDNALSNLSDKVLQAMNAYNADGIATYISNNPTHNEDVCIEILRRIHAETILNAEYQMILWTECAAKIHAILPFAPCVLQKLDSNLFSIYERIPHEVAEANVICQFAKDMNSIGADRLKQTLFAYIKFLDNETEDTYHQYVENVLRSFCEQDDCEELSEFAEGYMYNVKDINAYIFTDIQRRYLLTSTFAMKAVNAISSTSDEHLQRLLCWSFANLIDLQCDIYEQLFTRFKALVGNRNYKKATAFMDVVQYVLPILKSIAVTTDTVKLSDFYHSIVDKRVTPSNQNISIESEVNDENAKLLAEFCMELYRISGETLTINPTLENIQKKCEEYVKDRLIARARNEGNMLPFRRNILALHTIDDLWYELIPFAFEKDSSGKIIDEALLKEKMQLLYENMEDDRALALLVKLTEDNYMCELFLSLIDSNDYNTLNNLPKSLLPRIIGQYTAENADKFRTNNAMLKVVLQKGSINQEGVVSQTLIGRINDNIDVEGALDVIISFDGWHSKNKIAMKGLLLQQMPDDYEEKDKNEIELSDLQEQIKITLEKLK